MAGTSTVTLADLRAWGACGDAYRAIKRRYPKGVPLTVEAGLALDRADVDVLWGAVRLLDDDERAAFVLFTLRQRQPFLVALLHGADLSGQAAATAMLRFDTAAHASAAAPPLDAAADAAHAHISNDRPSALSRRASAALARAGLDAHIAADPHADEARDAATHACAAAEHFSGECAALEAQLAWIVARIASRDESEEGR